MTTLFSQELKDASDWQSTPKGNLLRKGTIDGTPTEEKRIVDALAAMDDTLLREMADKMHTVVPPPTIGSIEGK